MICPSCKTENDGSAESCFRCGAGLYALTEGAVLAARYEIQSFIGKGGMGMVYKAHDRALDEVVALKVLRGELAGSDELARRFRSEIKLARKVRHKNVCGIHEYGQDGNFRFIVMELIEGVDLRRILRERGAFPPQDAANLGLQVAAGLQAIHEVGIVHRDLKTPNIMLDPEGIVRLMDFGIAKQAESQAATGLTATGHIVGTPEYMSPEQALGHKIDSRSDIYALGIVMFELFTGDVPFRGETPLATIFKHVQEPPPLDNHPSLPIPIVDVLRRALAKAPEDRFATAHDMAEALHRARDGETPVARSVSETPGLQETRAIVTPTPGPLPGGPPPSARTPISPLPAARARTPLPSHTPQASRPRPATGRRPTPAARVPQPVSRGVSTRGRWVIGLGGAVVLVAGAVGLVLLARGLRAPEPEPSDRSAPSPAISSPASAEAEQSMAAQGPPLSTLAEPDPQSTPAPPSSPEPTPRRAAVPPSRETQRVRSPSPPPTTTAPATSRRTGVPVTLSRRPPAEPSPEPAVAPTGFLQLLILPWAEVAIDGEAVGTTPIKPVRLAPGSHVVVLSHPAYVPLRKTVAIRAGETVKLEIDLSFEAFPK